MRLILLLLSGCISAHADTADTAPDSVPAQDSAFCVDWCPDVDGDGLGAPDLACAAVCLPPGSVPDPSACTYVANCSDPEPMVAGHSKPVLALIRRTEGHSYPKNGNAHNPTPRYNWLVMANGKIVDQSARMANVLETAAEVAAELAANR